MRPTEPGNVQTRVAGRDAELRSLPRSSLRQWQELVSLVAGRENRKRSLSFANGFFVGLFLCLGLLGLERQFVSAIRSPPTPRGARRGQSRGAPLPELPEATLAGPS